MSMEYTMRKRPGKGIITKYSLSLMLCSEYVTSVHFLRSCRANVLVRTSVFGIDLMQHEE